MKNVHKITISGPVINYDVDVEGTVAAQVYQGLEKLINVANGNPEEVGGPLELPKSSVLSTNISPKEYLMSVDATTNPQKILAFAKYLTDKGQESVGVDELRLQFQNAREPIPAYLVRDLGVAIKKAWIAPTSSGKGYYVTNTGEKVLESKFSGTEKNKTKSTRKARNVSFTEVKIDPKVIESKIDTDLAGFPSFMDLYTSGDKILWILAKAKTLGLDRLNQKEVEYLTDKLGDHIPRKSISGVLIAHIRNKRLFTPLEDGARYLKILNPGLDYLKTIKKNK